VESNRIEYKRELTDSLEKEVIAFLNYRDGGVIFIGIDSKTHKAVGVVDGDSVQLIIKDRLKNNILPSCLGLFDVIHENHDGKDVIKITLASGSEKPYYLRAKGMSEKGCFIRIGSASEPMPLRMIEELFAKRTRHSIGKIKSPRQDLTFEQLKIYYQEAGFEVGEKFIANLELLTEEGAYNYAAYLLADKNGNSVQVAKYSGLNQVDLIENNEYGYCSLIKSCKQVLDKLELENRTATKITSKERLNHRLWNQVALREAVINAIIHNDYTNETAPKFEIFDDRMEITSAGSIPPGVEREEFFQGYSAPRNKILMRIFKDLDMVEHLGSGMPRILKAYPREAYVFTTNFIRIVFPVSKKALALEKKGNSTRKSKEESTEEKTTGKKKLQERNYRKETTGKIADRVLELCRQNKSITITEIAKKLELTADGINFHMKNLQEKNLLVRIGGRKIGHWEVLELKKPSKNTRPNTPKTTGKKTTEKKKLQERNYRKETTGKASKNSGGHTSELLAKYGKNNQKNLGEVWKKTKNSTAEKITKHDNLAPPKMGNPRIPLKGIATKVIEILKTRPHTTGKEIAESLSVSQSAIEKNINKLQKAGLLKHHGPTKNGYWEVLEKKK
jgi:predicted HTH transcriptional regulator